MSNDNYDDGLVHGHCWSSAPAPASRDDHPVADASAARTPSTAYHDDMMFCD